MKCLLASIMLLICGLVQAQELPQIMDLSVFTTEKDTTYTWQKPTTRVNGDAFPDSEYAYNVLGCVFDPGALLPSVDSAEYREKVNGLLLQEPMNDSTWWIVPKSQTSMTLTNFTPKFGEYKSCQISAVDTDGVPSLWSNAASPGKSLPPVQPGAPSGLEAATQ